MIHFKTNQYHHYVLRQQCGITILLQHCLDLTTNPHSTTSTSTGAVATVNMIDICNGVNTQATTLAEHHFT